MKATTTEKDGRKYEIRCPKCRGPNIWFDAHAGFATCKDCHFDTQECGPDPCYFEVKNEDSN